MGGTNNIYGGTNYGLSPDYGSKEYGTPISHYVSAGQISLATDPRTANQLKMTSEKINTGGKAVEVQMTMPNIAEAIPNEHLDEINRLRKLTGVDLTLHGPLVEPSGINPQAGKWEPTMREQAERQMWDSLKRAHKIKPDGNIVVTFHSSNGLPEPESKAIVNGEEVTTGLFAIDERTGSMGQVPKTGKDYITGKDLTYREELTDLNKRSWTETISGINIENRRAIDTFREIEKDNEKKEGGLSRKDLLQSYNQLQNKKYYESLPEEQKKVADDLIGEFNYAERYIKHSYQTFKELFNKAYDWAEKAKQKDELDKLDKLRKEIAPIVKSYTEDNDKSQIAKLAEQMDKGLRVLDEMRPEIYKPIKEFAIDKAATTFGNLAWNAYNEFEKKNETAPIISIENPPVGMGLSRAEDLKELIEASRKKFIEKAKVNGLSESEAEEKAEKLIGATWDVGHINMLRKYGYGNEKLKEQTKTVAPFVKHIHLSDNFGYEHTELPMGMGNVPMKEHLGELQKQFGDKLKEIKQVVETGDWYQHFQTTPLLETFSAFGSPIYAMKAGPHWNQALAERGAYWAGNGYNPDVHHSIYGSGFSNLPTELGGQMSGRSRMSGNSME